MDYLSVPTMDGDGVNVIVETPRGSRAKFKFAPRAGAFMMSRPLALGLHYPFDWGFIPSTMAEDGDPLDALIIHDAVSYPGMIIRCRPVAILEVRQSERGLTRRNDRVMVAPSESRRQESLDDLRALSYQMREELERFFLASTIGTDKKLEFLGWRDRNAARFAIEAAARKYRDGQPGSLNDP